MKSSLGIMGAIGALIASDASICVENVPLGRYLGMAHLEDGCGSGAALGPSFRQWVIVTGLVLLLLASTSSRARDALRGQVARLFPLRAIQPIWHRQVVGRGRRKHRTPITVVSIATRGPPVRCAPALATLN